jgi:hypothetical protein
MTLLIKNLTLAELEERLEAFEGEFGLSSEEFFARYVRGEMGDDSKVIKWAGTYRLYLDLVSAQELPETMYA